jgi:GTP-binding protein Era
MLAPMQPDSALPSPAPDASAPAAQAATAAQPNDTPAAAEPAGAPERAAAARAAAARTAGAGKSGFVAVVGRPSAGKSTLVNSLCGAKVAITSPVPQTTRNAIRGIVNRPEGQLVFVDTPGRHTSAKKLNKKLMDVGARSLGEADLALYVIDATRPAGEEEEAVASLLAPIAGRVVVAVNKVDAKGADEAAARAFVADKLPKLPAGRVLAVSALAKTGLDELLTRLFALSPDGRPFYPDDYYTDQEIDFRVAEIIREKAINRLKDELPHAVYVEVEDTELNADSTRLWVRAFIIVERDSQKGIVVGRGGEMIKAIRQAAQKDLNKIFDWKVELDLRVKVGKDWRQNDATLQRLIGK